ncbi:hypothetical protein EG329_009683 [Mollisiaceae sp. DMI_Dod_QoI]|nr:hypothetical protein EG329_009683 [Helotiales sp. DMI_Dod_QoI]
MSLPSNSTSSTIPILLLKTKSTPHDGYYDQFTSSNQTGLKFQPTFVPVLEHQLLEDGLKTVRYLLQQKQISNEPGSKYGGMIFTSQRAVEAFAKLVEEGKGDPAWPHLPLIPLYTVGPATTRALRSIPQIPPLQIFGEETGNGEALAHYILSHYPSFLSPSNPNPKSNSNSNPASPPPPPHSPPPLLFLVGEQRRDIIPKTLETHIPVHEIPVYGTGIMSSFPQDFAHLLSQTENQKMRWVVVFSPTGCEAMLQALGLLDPETGRARARRRNEEGRETHGEKEGGRGCRTYIATIGPTTRDFVRERFGFEPDVCAAKPSPEGVEGGIREFMKERC